VKKAYATTLLLHGDLEFEVGDEIHQHYDREALEKLIVNGHASHKRPAGVKTAVSLIDGLTYLPPNCGIGHRRTFNRGDRLDGVSAAVVRQIVGRGLAAVETADADKPKG
jgi:hypothetical protein